MIENVISDLCCWWLVRRVAGRRCPREVERHEEEECAAEHEALHLHLPRERATPETRVPQRHRPSTPTISVQFHCAQTFLHPFHMSFRSRFCSFGINLCPKGDLHGVPLSVSNQIE